MENTDEDEVASLHRTVSPCTAHTEPVLQKERNSDMIHSDIGADGIEEVEEIPDKREAPRGRRDDGSRIIPASIFSFLARWFQEPRLRPEYRRLRWKCVSSYKMTT